MKRYAEMIFCLLAPIVMVGCLEIHVRTTVSPDGSSERVISMKRSTKDLPPYAFPASADSTWSVEWKETGEKDMKYEFIASKKFKTPDDLRLEYASRPDTGIIRLSVSIDKRFEWFYTHLDYREVYTMRHSHLRVPVSEYLSKEEIERYVHGEKSDSLESKVGKWDLRNIFEDFYPPLVAEAERRNDPALPASLLLEKKMELFGRLFAADSADKRAHKKDTDSTKKKVDIAGDILKLFAEVLRTKAVFTLRPVAEQSLNNITKEADERKSPDGWTCYLQMPGLLLETNSDAVEGNTLTWKFGANQIHVGDYVMHAASRVANVWAFVITGFVALTIVMIAIMAAFRRRR